MNKYWEKLKTLKIVIILFNITMSFNLFSETNINQDFNTYFLNAQYDQALLALSKIDSKELISGQVAYLSGLCYSKQQEFDLAVKSFNQAIIEKNENIDLYYEFGQALYATNELKAAREAFVKSFAKKYNTSQSLYYIAHISQLLEDYNFAKEKYIEILETPHIEINIKQISQFQLAETVLAILNIKKQNQEKLEKDTEAFVVPLLYEAIKTSPNSSIILEIKNRLAEILREYNLDPNLLKNGRHISPKRFNSYFVQRLKYDDNISLTSEQNNIQQSKKQSVLFESEAYASYDFVIKKRFIISPSIRGNYIQHQNQKDSEVYQNDAYTFTGNLKNKYEHIINDHPASLILDLEYGKNYKDWKQTHVKEAYADTLAIALGERFNFFSAGDTNFKIKRKNFNGVNPSISNRTTSVSIDQITALHNQHLLIALLEVDQVINFNNPTTNTDTYLARFDYLIPEILPTYTLDIALTSTITDTKEQKSTRGTELMLNPSIDFSKDINEHAKISINFDYSKNKSKMSDYNYQKNIFTLEFRYGF